MRANGCLLLVILVFLLVRFVLNRVIEIRQQQKTEADAQNSAGDPSANGQMVRCAQCGVHLPQSEAYYDGKDTFCSEGHMKTYHEEHNEQ